MVDWDVCFHRGLLTFKWASLCACASLFALQVQDSYMEMAAGKTGTALALEPNAEVVAPAVVVCRHPNQARRKNLLKFLSCLMTCGDFP